MENKISGIVKAAAAGAVFGGVVAMISVPSSKKMRRRGSLAKNASKTLHAIGDVMDNLADMIMGR